MNGKKLIVTKGDVIYYKKQGKGLVDRFVRKGAWNSSERQPAPSEDMIYILWDWMAQAKETGQDGGLAYSAYGYKASNSKLSTEPFESDS